MLGMVHTGKGGGVSRGDTNVCKSEFVFHCSGGDGLGRSARIGIHHHHNYSHQCLITCTWRFVPASRKILIVYHHYHLRLLSVFPSGTGGCSLTALLFTSIRHVKYLFPFR